MNYIYVNIDRYIFNCLQLGITKLYYNFPCAMCVTYESVYNAFVIIIVFTIIATERCQFARCLYTHIKFLYIYTLANGCLKQVIKRFAWIQICAGGTIPRYSVLLANKNIYPICLVPLYLTYIRPTVCVCLQQ